MNVAIFYQSVKSWYKLFKCDSILSICYGQGQTVQMWSASINLLQKGTNGINVVIFYQSVIGRYKLFKCDYILSICYGQGQTVQKWSSSIILER